MFYQFPLREQRPAVRRPNGTPRFGRETGVGLGVPASEKRRAVAEHGQSQPYHCTQVSVQRAAGLRLVVNWPYERDLLLLNNTC